MADTPARKVRRIRSAGETAYETSDGRVFAEAAQAETHQALLQSIVGDATDEGHSTAPEDSSGTGSSATFGTAGSEPPSDDLPRAVDGAGEDLRRVHTRPVRPVASGDDPATSIGGGGTNGPADETIEASRQPDVDSLLTAGMTIPTEALSVDALQELDRAAEAEGVVEALEAVEALGGLGEKDGVLEDLEEIGGRGQDFDFGIGDVSDLGGGAPDKDDLDDGLGGLLSELGLPGKSDELPTGFQGADPREGGQVEWDNISTKGGKTTHNVGFQIDVPELGKVVRVEETVSTDSDGKTTRTASTGATPMSTGGDTGTGKSTGTGSGSGTGSGTDSTDNEGATSTDDSTPDPDDPGADPGPSDDEFEEMTEALTAGLGPRARSPLGPDSVAQPPEGETSTSDRPPMEGVDTAQVLGDRLDPYIQYTDDHVDSDTDFGPNDVEFDSGLVDPPKPFEGEIEGDIGGEEEFGDDV